MENIMVIGNNCPFNLFGKINIEDFNVSSSIYFLLIFIIFPKVCSPVEELIN